MKKIINILIPVIALIVFIYSSYSLIVYFGEAKKENDLYQSIKETVAQTPVKIEIETKEKILESLEDVEIEPEGKVVFPDERIQRQENLFSLYFENNDLIGWITIPDLVIDYPVMQTIAEPDYYLKHDFNKNKSSHGCIYMDYNVRLKYTKNRLLYGHHMKNGSMFASLVKYDSIDFYNGHPIIEFDTLSTLNDYQIIGAFKSPQKDLESLQKVLLLSDESQFNTFKEYFEKNRFYDTGVDFSYDDSFLTLMTCEYTYKNGRFFVLAKKIK